ncbi:unnamed protein product [Mesocestoides corti]|uniref:Uncharacterized protein n=1 Tax=Mesocestoides corti TaxID=53468 RepID=A0A0R3UR17_MESCO|nr:unnamed protein product [Mesocestoides corti]
MEANISLQTFNQLLDLLGEIATQPRSPTPTNSEDAVAASREQEALGQTTLGFSRRTSPNNVPPQEVSSVNFPESNAQQGQMNVNALLPAPQISDFSSLPVS